MVIHLEKPQGAPASACTWSLWPLTVLSFRTSPSSVLSSASGLLLVWPVILFASSGPDVAHGSSQESPNSAVTHVEGRSMVRDLFFTSTVVRTCLHGWAPPVPHTMSSHVIQLTAAGRLFLLLPSSYTCCRHKMFPGSCSHPQGYAKSICRCPLSRAFPKCQNIHSLEIHFFVHSPSSRMKKPSQHGLKNMLLCKTSLDIQRYEVYYFGVK